MTNILEYNVYEYRKEGIYMLTILKQGGGPIGINMVEKNINTPETRILLSRYYD